MTNTARLELRRIGLVILLGLFVTLMLDSLWPVLIVVAAYLLYFTHQLLRLFRWASRYEHGSEPPLARGAWGELFDTLYRILRREKAEKQALEQLIERAEDSVTALRDAVIVLDKEGHIEYWNQSAERLLGLKSPHDKRQTLSNLVRDPRYYHYIQKSDYRQPLVIPAPHQEQQMLEFTLTRFGHGDTLLLVRDVTRLHNLEQMRKDFVANVSHELKTPLTVLKGYLETLLGSTPDTQTRLLRALQQMQEQSNRMELLVQDLLLLARLENTDNTNNHRPVALAPMLATLEQDARVLGRDKQHKIQLEISEDACVQGELGELQSAFGNLISNAVKYTPANGEIQIRWWQDDSGGHLSVTDNGIGVAPEHLPRLTERFYRPDLSRVTHTGGTGLGLAIVKHVMLRHQGRLEVQSQLNKGSTFSCHFPPERLATLPATRKLENLGRG